MSGKKMEYLKDLFLWRSIKRRYHIDDKTVVLVFPGQRQDLEESCIKYLKIFMSRKGADKAIIFYREKTVIKMIKDKEEIVPVRLKEKYMSRLYELYSFMKFFDNIIFAYADSPADNMLGKCMDETDINSDDAAALALYHLRYVP